MHGLEPHRFRSVITTALPHPLLFASVSGAHLYGFPSPDSDVDLRGCHVLPARALPAEPDVAAVEALVVNLHRASLVDPRFSGIHD